MLPRGYADADGSRWLLKALRETAHELESQLWDLAERELRWRPSEDGWSLKEIAAHLRDCEEHFVESLESIAFHDQPRLRVFDADALVFERDYRGIDVLEALGRFEELRERSVYLLWGEDDWQRSGVHPYLGPVTMAQLVRQQNEHDLEHLWQARRIRERMAQGAPAR
jgi:hypothetical protein